ncbi:MAG: hypothetical protein ACOVMM_08060 [Chitinophagaceae bacterium]
MKKLFFSFVLLNMQICFAQIITGSKVKQEEIIEKPVIFRAQIMFPYGVSLHGNAEVKLLKPLSVNVSVGAIGVTGTTSDIQIIDPNEEATSIAGFLSIEPRLYFNLGYRKKRERNIKNFSGNYIGFRYFLSTPSIFKNKQDYSFENTRAYQVHIGTQHQLGKKAMVGGNIGWVLYQESVSSNHIGPVYPTLQLGLTVGYVF